MPADAASELVRLRRRYEPPTGSPYQAFSEVARCYRMQRQAQVLDIASTATALGHALWLDTPDPLALEAFERANPRLSLSDLRHFESDQLQGIANNTKGTYFELLVADRLNAGEAVGGIQLPEGFRAVIAERLNQPGWDLTLVDPSGAPAEYLQLKATDNLGYVRNALERYPDIQVLTTSDVPAEEGLILSSDMSDSELESSVDQFLDESLEGAVGDFWDAFVPLAPLLVIAATEGYRVAVGRTSISAAAEHAKTRAARALFASGAGAAAYALGAGWFSVPVAMGAGALLRRSLNQVEMVEAVEMHAERLQALSRFQQLKHS